MFDNIGQLEREVKEFRKNILASSELVETVDALLATVKNQTTDLSALFSETISKLDDHVNQIQMALNETAEKIERNANETTSQLCKENEESLSRLSVDNEKFILSAVSKITDAQQEHTNTMRAVEETVVQNVETLCEQYRLFLAKLETTNMDQIYKTCMEIKAGLAARFTLLYVGVGLSVVISVISLFLK